MKVAKQQEVLVDTAERDSPQAFAAFLAQHVREAFPVAHWPH